MPMALELRQEGVDVLGVNQTEIEGLDVKARAGESS